MFPSRSRASRFSGRRLIATVRIHLAHKSCAVKLHAYSLDSSVNCASALQQNMLFPQLLESLCFYAFGMIWAVRRASPCSLIKPETPAIECNAEICADRRYSCRCRTRPPGRIGGAETISLDRWAD